MKRLSHWNRPDLPGAGVPHTFNYTQLIKNRGGGWTMLEEVEKICPYCGSPFSLSIECALEVQTYYEDCPHCCQSIQVDIRCSHKGELEQVELKTDRE
jgi:hypothetical protein